jgi:hypothetical protein
MKTDILQDKATALENELADLYAMSEEAACFRYNVDEKQEAIDILDDELRITYRQIDEAAQEERELNWGGVDPAFASMAEFDRMRT